MFFLGSFKGEISKLDAGADKGLTFTKLKKDDWAMCAYIIGQGVHWKTVRDVG